MFLKPRHRLLKQAFRRQLQKQIKVLIQPLLGKKESGASNGSFLYDSPFLLYGQIPSG
jgi:hypothetical protein